jgi:hypothetical protein
LIIISILKRIIDAYIYILFNIDIMIKKKLILKIEIDFCYLIIKNINLIDNKNWNIILKL